MALRGTTAAETRAEMLALIRQGRFANRAELNQFLASAGLAQTRNGSDFVTWLTPTKEKVRLYLPPRLHVSLMDPSNQRNRRDGSNTFLPGLVPCGARDVFSVYVIAALAPNGDLAAYVGSTGDLRHRLAEHFHGRDGTSVDLADWARIKKAVVRVSPVMSTNDRGGAIQLEGAFTAELKRRGWYLPGVTRWGAAARVAVMMEKSFRHSHIIWSEPVLTDMQTWPLLKTYKFYG